jgi:hypothetical protein
MRQVGFSRCHRDAEGKLRPSFRASPWLREVSSGEVETFGRAFRRGQETRAEDGNPRRTETHSGGWVLS